MIGADDGSVWLEDGNGMCLCLSQAQCLRLWRFALKRRFVDITDDDGKRNTESLQQYFPVWAGGRENQIPMM